MLAEFTPGLALKGFALACRVIFVLAVLPTLASGELGNYLFIVTIALLIARLASLGVEDELPLRIKGRETMARGFFRYYLAVASIALVSVLLYFALGFAPILAGALALTYLAQFILSGCVRSVRPLSYEVLVNTHWLFFVTSALLLGGGEAAKLVVFLITSLYLNHVIVIWVSGIRLFAALPTGLNRLTYLGAVRVGWQKCISNFCDLANTRSIIIWPKLLKAKSDIDDLAFAVACGDIVWQFGMVPVQRRFARYCQGVMSPAQKFWDAFRLSVVLVGLSLVLSGATQLLQEFIPVAGFIDWHVITVLEIMFGFAAGYAAIRYAVWSEIGFSWRLLINEAFAVAAAAIAIYLLERAHWPYIALVLFAFLFLFGIIRANSILRRPVVTSQA